MSKHKSDFEKMFGVSPKKMKNKTETEITRENIKCRNLAEERTKEMFEAEGKIHRKTCQRWLEFLEKLNVPEFITQDVGDGYQEDYNVEGYEDVEKKITDLKSSIKLYSEAGI